MKRISTDDHYTVVSDEEKVMLDSAELKPGKYISCMYGKDWYVGSIAECSDEYCDVFVNFMNQANTGLLSWPTSARKNACWVPFQNVICLVSAPEPQGQSARFYKLSPGDTELVLKKLPSFV